MMNDSSCDLLSAFAGLLDYPGPDLAARAARAVSALERDRSCLEAAAELAGFARFVAATDPGRLEELYTVLFDLPATCPPYAGHQLLGEDWRRSLLLARLNHRYRERGFTAGRELADHLTVLLRYLALGGHGADEDELMRELLLPCLDRMTATLGADDQRYGALLRSLRGWLRAQLDEADPRAAGGVAAAGGIAAP